MRVTRKAVHNLTDDEVRELEKLTYSWGDMCPQLHRFRCGSAAQGRPAHAFRLRGEDGELRAWALLFRDWSLHAYVYVPTKWRRRGYATRLLEAAKRTAEPAKVTVCPWNGASQKFFDTIRDVAHEWRGGVTF